ncbi:MAG: PhoH family protein [Acidobacteriota bacterium]
MRSLQLPVRGAEILFDVRDENVRLLESLFDVRISARGSQVSIEGPVASVNRVEEVLTDFARLVEEGRTFSNGDLQRAFEELAHDASAALRECLPEKIVLRTPQREVTPRSLNQARYLQAIAASDLVFAIGPAGTGKTYLAVAQAVVLLLAREVRRIILARPAVEAGERLGFLPGDLQEKVNPYLRPLYDALYDMLDVEKVQKMIERGIIEIAPLAFMRGRTLSEAFIILDEAQNATHEQMKMFLTRIGPRSKVVVTGDVTQVDLPPGQISGLVQATKILHGIEEIRFCYFDHRDVVRHRLVKLIIQAYDRAARNGE